VTGQPILDYLQPRLFRPLGIQGATWETCPRGINVGGWGLSVQTESLAKFGQLYFQKGVWHGRQILPAQWIDEATTFKIQQPLPEKPSRPTIGTTGCRAIAISSGAVGIMPSVATALSGSS